MTHQYHNLNSTVLFNYISSDQISVWKPIKTDYGENSFNMDWCESGGQTDGS